MTAHEWVKVIGITASTFMLGTMLWIGWHKDDARALLTRIAAILTGEGE